MIVTNSDKSPKFFVVLKVLLLVALISAIVVALVLTARQDKPIRDEGAITTNGIECAAIGKSIVDAGGSAADVAVATILCEGITCPQSSGLGGGFLVTIYTKQTGIVETLNAREVAPKLSNSTMYVNDSRGSVRGGKAVAVPGELKGLWELHQKYGKLPWKKLVEPSIKLAREGHVVSPYLENVFASAESDLHGEPSLGEIYIDPRTNHTFKLNDIIKREQLAKTLEVIAEEGVDCLYGGGSLVKELVKEIRERGGIITEDDFMDYKVRWRSPVSTVLNDNSTFYTFPLPSNGAIIVFMLNLLKDYDLKHDALSYHRIIEAFKFAYAKRSLLGDEPSDEIKEMMANLTSFEYAKEVRTLINDETTSQDFSYYGAKYENREDHGTAHISILMPNGDAVAATATINYKLGAFWRSKSTGIIMNNEMDDFSTPGFVNIYGIPASPANFIQPGKNPLSSMAPSIQIDDKGNPKLIIGGAGGSRIPTGVAFSMIRHLFMGDLLTDAIEARRLHHQLAPMNLLYETGFDMKIVSELNEKFGHRIVENLPDGGFAAVVGIAKTGGKAEGVIDPRRGGSVELLK